MSNKELKPCPFCCGEAEVDYRLGVCSVVCKGCGARVSSFRDVNPAIKAWNNRVAEQIKPEISLDGIHPDLINGLLEAKSNYLEKQDISNELLDFVKFCRNASATNIRQIHDRARDLIAKHKQSCEKSCKEENATLKPLIPKWSKNSYDTLILNVNVMQCVYIEFDITNEENKYRLTAFLKAHEGYCNKEDGGIFNTIEEAKEKANEYIKWIGERLVCFAENIRIEE